LSLVGGLSCGILSAIFGGGFDIRASRILGMAC